MAVASLLALIDDIASVLDDVAAMTKVASAKAAGVLGDDLALNAQQVAGLRAERELPVVWAVAQGSLRNKAILVPAALAVSALAPWAVTPLLVVGGAYLCFEGFEKLAHQFLPHETQDEAAQAEPTESTLALAGLQEQPIDLVELEKTKIAGAVRTDFILSGEIIVITLGIVASAPLLNQVAVLGIVAVAMTVGVYGAVAGIVKLDDAGLWLSLRPGRGAFSRAQHAFGRGILVFAPFLMKALAVVGTAAMFLVGGSILSHGLPFLHHTSAAVTAWLAALPASGGVVTVLAALAPMLFDVAAGIAAGALVLASVVLFGRARRLLGP